MELMEFYKKFKREIIGIGVGIGLTLLSQFTYNALTGPDFVYRHRHFGDPSEYGKIIIDWRGTGEQQEFIHGKDIPSYINELVDTSFNRIESWDLLHHAGIEKDTPISELRIEIKK